MIRIVAALQTARNIWTLPREPGYARTREVCRAMVAVLILSSAQAAAFVFALAFCRAGDDC